MTSRTENPSSDVFVFVLNDRKNMCKKKKVKVVTTNYVTDTYWKTFNPCTQLASHFYGEMKIEKKIITFQSLFHQKLNN